MKELLPNVPDEVKELILGLAVSNGYNLSSYNSDLDSFFTGALAMHQATQKRIADLEVEIDLLEGELSI